MAAVTFAMEIRPLLASISRFSGAAQIELRAGFQRAMGMLARRAVAITPPAKRGNVPGGDDEMTSRRSGFTITPEDKRRGESSLARDLEAIFVPVQRARVGPGGDQNPESIHRRVFTTGKVPGRPLKNDREQPYFVDAARLRALERKLKKQVGRLPGEWNKGVQAAGATSPAWVARHGTSNGSGSLNFVGVGIYQFLMSANDVPSSVRGEIVRRLGYAMRYTRRSLDRGTKAILLKSAGRAGFDTRNT